MTSNSIIENIELRTVKSILGIEAYNKFKEGNLPNSLLAPYAKAIKEISEFYVSKDRNTFKLEEIHANAYALYYLTINAAKFQLLFSEIPSEFWNKPLKILDFGSGPGTGTITALNLSDNIDSISIVESNKHMRDVASSLLAEYKKKLSIVSTLSELKEGEFDIILCGNVFNELSGDNRLKIARTLISLLKKDGYLIILEPALQKITREAMSLRDSLVNEGLNILFPCTHNNMCPMLKDSETDWCHGEIRWQTPRLVDHLDELCGFNKHRIKYSGFVFTFAKVILGASRVVGYPIKINTVVKIPICDINFYGYKNFLKSENKVKIKKIKVYDLL